MLYNHWWVIGLVLSQPTWTVLPRICAGFAMLGRQEAVKGMKTLHSSVSSQVKEAP
jgi:hypothetical protein